MFSLRFKVGRPSLSVVIYPLQHEDLSSVIRGIPRTLLDGITLFQSHVAQPPRLSPFWHHQTASVWLVLSSWGAQTVLSCRKYNSWIKNFVSFAQWFLIVWFVASATVSVCPTTHQPWFFSLHFCERLMMIFKGNFPLQDLLVVFVYCSKSF